MKIRMKKLAVIGLLLMMVLSLTACGDEEKGPLAAAGSGAPLQAGDKVDAEAAYEGNRLMTGEGVAIRGHKVYLDDVPLAVREKDLARALPDKELLRLAAKYQAFPTEEDLKGGLSPLAQDADGIADAAQVISLNGQLKDLLADKVETAWRADRGILAKIRQKDRSTADWEAFLAKQDDKDKTDLILRR